MNKNNIKKIKNFKPSIPDEVRNDPKFRKEIKKFIKALVNLQVHLTELWPNKQGKQLRSENSISKTDSS